METYLNLMRPSALPAVRTLVSGVSSALPALHVAVSACAEPVALRVRGAEVAVTPWTRHVAPRTVSPQAQFLGTSVDAGGRNGITNKVEAMKVQLIAAQRGVPPRGRPV